MQEEQKKDHKKSKISEFLSDKTNRTFLIILIIAFIIRIYYFILTKNQPLWWDESEYLVTAKHWALGVPWEVNAQRPILFPLLFTIIYKLGISDIVGKFLFVLLPSLGTVIVSYFLAREMYDKKIALLVSTFISIFYLLIFNTTRFHTDALSMLFGLLAIYCFWKGYVNEKSRVLIWLVGVFLALNFATRLVAILIAATIVAYLILTTGIKFLKNKDLWISFGLGILTISVYLIYNLLQYNKIFAFTAGYVRPEDLAVLTANPPAWYVFSFIGMFLGIVMLIVFIVGMIFCYKLIIGYDIALKEKDKKSFADLFLILILLIHIIWFVFVQRAAEDRWLLPISFALFALVSKGLIVIFDNIKKYNKTVAAIVVGVILIIGAYHQFSLSDQIIKSKISSYSKEPVAGKFLKENTKTNDIIISNNEVAPLAYYTERKIFGFVDDKQSVINTIKQFKPKYLVLTAYAPTRSWTNEFLEEYQNKLTVVQAYTENYNGQQLPAVIIYSFKDYNF